MCNKPCISILILDQVETVEPLQFQQILQHKGVKFIFQFFVIIFIAPTDQHVAGIGTPRSSRMCLSWLR